MLQVANSFRCLPKYIQGKLSDAPLFYSEAYESYLRQGNQVVYLYGEDFIQIVGIHVVASIFKYANLPVEPYRYKQSNSNYSEKDFLNEVVEELKRMRVCWIPVTPASSVFLSYPDESSRIPWGNYIIDLTLTEEDLFKNVTSKHRNMIRKGEKNEIVIKYGGIELLKDYLILDAQTWERSGVIANNESVFNNYLEVLPNNSFIGIAYKESIPQCGLLGLYSKSCFYYEFGASAHRPEPGSTHYLQWKTILKMKSEGVKKYSFVGCRIDVDKDSKLSNIQHFKEGFGGSLVKSYLFKTDINKFKVFLYKCLLFIKSGRYPKDVIDQEKCKWSGIN